MEHLVALTLCGTILLIATASSMTAADLQSRVLELERKQAVIEARKPDVDVYYVVAGVAQVTTWERPDQWINTVDARFRRSYGK